MNIVDATLSYERWMASHVAVIRPDLAVKHRRMAESPFTFLRGTFYRWYQLWPKVCSSLQDGPVVPSVGDLHVENFGTWRDLEGRLVWGVNDVDEACALPYANDLVRLATSAVLAARQGGLNFTRAEICESIVTGYVRSIGQGGRPFVLAEQSRWLRRIALNDLRDPVIFWARFDSLRSAPKSIAPRVLREALPDPRLLFRVVRRVAGVGSLGRPRIVALADWQGARIAREAKALLPSAAVWAAGRRKLGITGPQLLARAVRTRDPYLTFHDNWIVRRLAPDCSRVELVELPRVRDEERLLRAMGAETGNIHLGRRDRAILADLKKRPRRWLERASQAMADAVEDDWRRWTRKNA